MCKSWKFPSIMVLQASTRIIRIFQTFARMSRILVYQQNGICLRPAMAKVCMMVWEAQLNDWQQELACSRLSQVTSSHRNSCLTGHNQIYLVSLYFMFQPVMLSWIVQNLLNVLKWAEQYLVPEATTALFRLTLDSELRISRISGENTSTIVRVNDTAPEETLADVTQYNLHPGQYVAAVYDNYWYLGNVVEVSTEQEDIFLDFMKRKGPATSFSWPTSVGCQKTISLFKLRTWQLQLVVSTNSARMQKRPFLICLKHFWKDIAEPSL